MVKLMRAFGTVLLALALAILGDTCPAFAVCNPSTPGSCVLSGGVPPQIGPAPGEQYTTVAAGLFAYTKTDLTVGGVMPIEVTRVYRSEDRDSSNHFIQRSFGAGARLSYDIFLYSSAEVNGGSNPYASAIVSLPDGGVINCQCAQGSNCSSYTTAQLVCNSQPTGAWFGSTIQYNSSLPGWSLTRKDGTVYSFGKGAPLQSISDRFSNQISIARGQTQIYVASSIGGNPTGRWVTLYTSGGVVTQATDNTNRIVNYQYGTTPGGQQRLTQVQYASINSDAKITYGYYSTNNPDSGGDIQSIVLNIKDDSSGNPVQNWNYITYDGQNRLSNISSQTPSVGTQYNYNTPNPGQVTVALPDPENQTSKRVFTFDSAGYLTQDQRGYNNGNIAEEDTTLTRCNQAIRFPMIHAVEATRIQTDRGGNRLDRANDRLQL